MNGGLKVVSTIEVFKGTVLVDRKVATSELSLASLDSLQPLIEAKENTKTARKPKKKTPAQEADADLAANALQLARCYSKLKKTFYHTAAVKEILPGEKAFGYFLDAVRLLKQHKVNYRKFLKAQIHGLSWMNNGKGMFPRPSHLTGEGAETRLLEYLKDTVTDSHDDVVSVSISPEDRRTQLQDNRRYVALAHKVKDRIADLEETVYVRELQAIRLGKVKPWVESHLERLVAGKKD